MPLVKAVQELSKLNTEKDSEINDLKLRLQKLESSLRINNPASASTEALLEQNTPNPANNNTVVRYSIPVSTNQAKIIVSNAAGHTIKTFSISNKGAGTITINANTLASGVYNYDLYADGRLIGTKQMVIAR